MADLPTHRHQACGKSCYRLSARRGLVFVSQITFASPSRSLKHAPDPHPPTASSPLWPGLSWKTREKGALAPQLCLVKGGAQCHQLLCALELPVPVGASLTPSVRWGLCWLASEVLEFSDLWILLNGMSIEKHSTGSEGRFEGRAEEQAGDRWLRRAEGVHAVFQSWWGSQSLRRH